MIPICSTLPQAMIELACLPLSHAHQPKDWSIKMNKKERRLALATALQSSTSDMMVIESLTGKVEDKKTKSLLAILEKVRD